MITGIGTLAFLVALGIGVGLSVTEGGAGGSSRPQPNTAPIPPPAAAANAAFSIRPVLCYAPPYAVASGVAATTGPLPTCSTSTALTAANLQVEVDFSNTNGYTEKAPSIRTPSSPRIRRLLRQTTRGIRLYSYLVRLPKGPLGMCSDQWASTGRQSHTPE